MKRLGLSLALPVFGLLAGVLAPGTASAHGFAGGGHAGGGFHGGGGSFHSAPAFHGGGSFHGAPAFHAGVGAGWRGGPVHVAAPARGYVGYGARPAYGYGARSAYGYGRAYYGAGPAAGSWGWHGATRVWIGGSVAPYAGWGWTAGQWVWNGNQWVWQDGYWAPPAY